MQIVDHDSSARTTYEAVEFDPDVLTSRPSDDDLASSDYHACNLFATAMATIGQFERALGRRVSFYTDTHQIKLAPHAFVGANAYYDRGSEAVLFGYFGGRSGNWIDTCLSYDIIVHEMTHAVLDGLRPRFVDPSSPDQAAFHEAFADIVALLSTLTRREVVEWALTNGLRDVVASRKAIDDALDNSILLGIAPQLGAELDERQRALRNSLELMKMVKARSDSVGVSGEAHDRGEMLVAAVLTAFRGALVKRLDDVLPEQTQNTSIPLVAEEASRVADLLLTVCIQAIDYTPPVHMEFSDYLSALLTVFAEFHDMDARVDVGEELLRGFEAIGIFPAVDDRPSSPNPSWRDCRWTPFDGTADYRDVRFEQIQSDRDEAFRFVFANLEQLGLDDKAYTRVLSVHPSVRVSPDDGFTVRETVLECLQRLQPNGAELAELLSKAGVEVTSLEGGTIYNLRGGTTLILGDHGQVKYSIHKRLIPRNHLSRLAGNIDYLQRQGWISTYGTRRANFAQLHQARRQVSADRASDEVWT
ncbi:MAG: hypothetical protein GY929_10190 [Actinomycetia bacterium]|nr:hypothetical protein [Actinomycetes bacterium]